MKKGNELAEELRLSFTKATLLRSNVKFYKAIYKERLQKLQTCLVKTKSGVQANVEVNRNILGSPNYFL